MINAQTHVSTCFSSQHNMVQHTITKSRLTYLCFWMFLTNISEASLKLYIKQYLCSFTVSPFSSLALQPRSSRIMHLSFILGIMSEKISEQQKSTTVAFTASVGHTEGSFLHLLLKYVFIWKQLYSKIFKHYFLFYGAFWKVALKFLGCFCFCASGFVWQTCCGLGR